MRQDANEIALRAISSILAAAHAFDFDIEGTKVACTTTFRAQEPWRKLRGLPETGTWPRAVNIECKGDGGSCMLRFEADSWVNGRYDQDITTLESLATNPGEAASAERPGPTSFTVVTTP